MRQENHHNEDPLKKILGSQDGELRNEQWLRLQNELQARKKRVPFIFWWIFGLAVILSATFGYLAGTQKSNEQQIAVSPNSQVQSEQEIENLTSPKQAEIKSIDTDTIPQNQIVTTNKQPSNYNKKGETLVYSDSESDIIYPDEDLAPIDPYYYYKNSNGEDSNTPKTEGELNNKDTITLPEVKIEEAPVLLANTEGSKGEEKDTTEKKKHDDDDVLPPPPPKMRFVGIQWNPSSMSSNTPVLNDDGKSHKDTRSIYNNSAASSRANIIKLFAELPLSKNLNITLQSGFQYRSLIREFQFNYKLNEIPFRDVDNSILTYIKVNDSAAENYNMHAKMVYRTLSIPLHFGYTFPINKKSTLGILLGTSVNMTIQNKGSILDVDKGGFVPYKAPANKSLSFDYAAQAVYSHEVYKKVYLGAGLGLRLAKSNIALNYGSLENRHLIQSLIFQLKYRL